MKRFVALACIGCIASLPGCGADPVDLPPGSLSVGWIVGTGGCDASGVGTVLITLQSDQQGDLPVRSYDCDTGETTIGSLAPGTYKLTLRGRASDGRDRYGAVVPDVEVRSEGNTRVGTIRLAALPATIVATWYFENGRMCTYNGITEVTVTLFDEHDYQKESQTVSCQAGEVELPGVEANSYLVNLDAQEEGGDILFNGQEEVVVDKGEEVEVEIRLSPVVGDR